VHFQARRAAQVQVIEAAAYRLGDRVFERACGGAAAGSGPAARAPAVPAGRR
jgi:hypothetical protein